MNEEEIINTVLDIVIYQNKNDNITENEYEALRQLVNLYKQEKEKNKELEKDNKNLNILLEAKYKDVTYMLLNYISKDKIKEKIKEWDESIKWNNADDHYYAIKILKDLLEEK